MVLIWNIFSVVGAYVPVSLSVNCEGLAVDFALLCGTFGLDLLQLNHVIATFGCLAGAARCFSIDDSSGIGVHTVAAEDFVGDIAIFLELYAGDDLHFFHCLGGCLLCH